MKLSKAALPLLCLAAICSISCGGGLKQDIIPGVGAKEEIPSFPIKYKGTYRVVAYAHQSNGWTDWPVCSRTGETTNVTLTLLENGDVTFEAPLLVGNVSQWSSGTGYDIWTGPSGCGQWNDAFFKEELTTYRGSHDKKGSFTFQKDFHEKSCDGRERGADGYPIMTNSGTFTKTAASFSGKDECTKGEPAPTGSWWSYLWKVEESFTGEVAM